MRDATRSSYFSSARTTQTAATGRTTAPIGPVALLIRFVINKHRESATRSDPRPTEEGGGTRNAGQDQTRTPQRLVGAITTPYLVEHDQGETGRWGTARAHHDKGHARARLRQLHVRNVGESPAAPQGPPVLRVEPPYPWRGYDVTGRRGTSRSIRASRKLNNRNVPFMWDARTIARILVLTSSSRMRHGSASVVALSISFRDPDHGRVLCAFNSAITPVTKRGKPRLRA
jgi:hypothetical protein